MKVTGLLIESIDFEIELLKTYVSRVEDAVKIGIQDYKDKVEFVETDDSIFRVHEGLDDETYHLETIFNEYFPNLQRSSALITLCSFFENSLNTICNELRNKTKASLSLSEITEKNGKINRAIIYLKKIIKLDIEETNETLVEIKKIQKLRNHFVHGFTFKLNMSQVEIKKYISENDFLSLQEFTNPNDDFKTNSDEEISNMNINEGFLLHVVLCYEKLLKEISGKANSISSQ